MCGNQGIKLFVQRTTEMLIALATEIFVVYDTVLCDWTFAWAGRFAGGV